MDMGSSSSDRQLAQTGTQEAPSEHHRIPFHWKGDQALAKVAHRVCGVSVPGDIKKCLGMVLGPVWPCLSRGFGPDVPKTSAMLWFCEGKGEEKQSVPEISFDSGFKKLRLALWETQLQKVSKKRLWVSSSLGRTRLLRCGSWAVQERERKSMNSRKFADYCVLSYTS